MATTFSNLQDRIFHYSGLDSTGDLTTVKALLNEAARNLWNAHPWPERFTEGFFTTVAPYITGTTTFTNGSQTLNGTGTTWATFTAGSKKVARAYGEASYIATRVSDTQLTLDRAFVDDTATDSEYVLYADMYDLAATCEVIVGEGLRLHTARPNGTLKQIPLSRLDQSDYIHGATGKPLAWTLLPDYTAGTRRVRIYPIPDDEYAISYLYRKSYTDMSADGDECVVLESRRDLIWKLALVDAAALAGKYEMSIWARKEYEEGLKRAKAVERPYDPAPVRFRKFDEPRVRNVTYMDVQDED